MKAERTTDDGRAALRTSNAAGELGDRTTRGRNRPEFVVGATDVTQIVVRDRFLALRSDGTVLQWGGVRARVGGNTRCGSGGSRATRRALRSADGRRRRGLGRCVCRRARKRRPRLLAAARGRDSTTEPAPVKSRSKASPRRREMFVNETSVAPLSRASRPMAVPLRRTPRSLPCSRDVIPMVRRACSLARSTSWSSTTRRTSAG